MHVHGLALLLVLALSLPAGAQVPTVSEAPDSVRLVTEDIARFWAVFDHATPETLAALLQSDYLDPGTAGVQDFTPNRIISADLPPAGRTRRSSQCHSAETSSDDA